jgi:hypothetical protein
MALKPEDIYAKWYEWEFCEPKDKAEKEREFNEMLRLACEQTGKPFYALKLALQKRYPQYRKQRLRNELPNLPPDVRGQ